MTELVFAETRYNLLATRLEKVLQSLTSPLSLIAVLGMLVAAGATVINVLLRYFFASGLAGLNEIIAMAFAVAVSACIPAGMARGVGIRVDLLEGALKPNVVAWLNAIGSAVLLVFLTILTYRIGLHSARLQAEGRITVILQLQQAPFLWSATLMLGLGCLVQALYVLTGVFKALGTRSDGPLNRASVIAIVMMVFLVAIAAFTALNFDLVSAWARSNPVLAVGTIMVLLWVALLVLVPLAAVMGVVGIVGCALFIGFGPATSAAATEAVGFLTSYQVASLPLFLLMGSFAVISGLSRDLFELANALLGRFRGGLAMATIGGSAGFGAVTGSSLATVVTFGKVAIPQMRERKYDPGFAAGCIAAGGTLGALIPPSSPLIIYALLTESSIGQLFAAALIPGLIALAFYLVTIAIAVRVKPGLAPAREPSQGVSVVATLRKCTSVFILFGAVIGGMYSGIFTATEAAAVGAFIAFAITLVRGKLWGENFWAAIVETTLSTVMIYTVLFAVLAFSFFVALSGLPETAADFVTGLPLPDWAIIAIILLVFLLLGCIMDSLSVMIITVPIVAPIIVLMGYDLIWWGIINLIVVEIGLMTPPFGLHLFVLKSFAPDIPLRKVYAGVLPFCLADALRLCLLVAVPTIVLWLPMSMAG